MLILLLLVLVLYGLLHLSPVQTWLVKKVANNLSQKLHTRVTVKKVDFSFFNKLDLQGLYIEDLKKDTLLYAGSAKVDITDWFFLKEKISFNYIGLEDAVVNLERSDSTWNYQFLLDYFSSPGSSKGGGSNLQFNFKEAHFKNLYFRESDQWVGQDMIVSLKSMDISIREFDLIKKRISIDEIEMDAPYFSQSNYSGRRPPKVSAAKTAVAIETPTAYQWNNDGWVMELNKLTISHGSFQNEKETERAPYIDRFDGQHLLFTDISATFHHVLFSKDTLSADIQLSSNERSGLQLKKLQASFKFTPEIMEFNNLDLITNKSRLRDYYSMRFDDFNEDMNNFIHNVVLEGHFKDSELNSDDLAIFAPNLASWKRIFYLEGTAKGSIDNFMARNMKIKSGHSQVEGDIALRGLPDINSTFIDFKAKGLQTSYADAVALFPSLARVTQPQLSKLGNIFYKGNFTGFLNDFVAFGTIITNMGMVTADLNMKLPETGIPNYSGKLMTTNFRLGEFINSKELGNISLNGTVKGSGFALKELNANFDGTIKEIGFNGYNFQNLAVKGDFKKNQFTGHLTIDDPNIKIKSLDGTLSLSGKEIAFNLDADLQYANLQEIHFAKEKFQLKGLFSLNFTGNNIDNFLGTARVYNAELTHDSSLLSFDSLTLQSYRQDDKKYLSIRSNEIDADISGQFTILELPDAFKVFLSRYYPTYIKKPSYRVSNQDFSFNINTKQVDEYIRLLDSRLSGFNDASISGNLNLAAYDLKVNAQVPLFSYDGKTFSNIRLTGNGNRDTLKADIAADDIQISDSLHFPATNLKLTANNDVSEIQLKTSAGKTLNDAEINASVQTLADGVKLHFFPSSFIINDKKWLLAKDGELTIRKNYLDANEVKFVHDDQQIALSTELDDVTDQTHIVAKLTKVDLEDFAPLVFKKPSVKGLLTGTANIRDPFGKVIIDFTGRADSFSLDKEYVGNVDLTASANTNTGQVTFKAGVNDSSNTFAIDGSYNYKDSSENQMNVDLVAKRIHLKILEPYLGTIFSRMDGYAATDLKLSGGPDHRYITGKATLQDDTLQIAYTKCTYVLKNETILFEKDAINFGKLTLRDTLNNSGTLSGVMRHRFFQDLDFENLRLETSKMLLLNTTKKDNGQFYGKVIGSAVMTIDGPTSNLQMNIDGQPSILDSSHIYLPTGAGKESNAIDYIEFIQFGSKMEQGLSLSQGTNITVNLNIRANPACKIDVILDEETGDIIKGQGNGLISMRVGTKEPLTMRGRYELTKGEYTFNFQTFLKKPFTLNRGSITWNGDPYLANIDIEAEYIAKNVDISGLSTTGGFRQKEDITIISHLTGILQKPDINFEFRLPEKSDANKDYIIVKRLADFQNDPNERNKQVASLLLFNSFIFGNQNFLSGGNTTAIFTNTVGGIISGLLTNFFNKELEKATNGVISTYIDINPTVDLQKNATQLQANVRAGLQILLSKRLVVLIGGNLDYNNPTYAQQLARKGLLTPDISIEWLLNKDGSLRVVGFNRSTIDFTLNQRNRSGVQLSYRKDFNNLSDIFKSKKKIEAAEEKKKTTPKTNTVPEAKKPS
ncbi:MAG TPA: translocation/assembly module TamB domain-containing protein [Ferruginibacter sp.]|nr:translocation/assembly module TamB domain-containing protein [Ferruginibacter sp.]